MVYSIPSLTELLTVIFRTFLIFTFTYIVIRLLGKKRLNQFSVFDLLIIISLGSAVGDVMIYKENFTQIIISLGAITTVGVLVRFYDEFIERFPKLQTFFEGDPVIVIKDGVIIEKILYKENITKKQLVSHLREKGIFKVEDVKKAILEPDGRISILD